MLAYAELSTDRQVGMSIGPIPSSAIRAYVRDKDMEPDLAAHFTSVMRHVDADTLRKAAERAKSATRAKPDAPS